MICGIRFSQWLYYINLYLHKSDLTDWMTAMIDKKKWTNATTVFSTKKCRNPDHLLTTVFRLTARKSCGGRAPRSPPGLLGFSAIDAVCNKHGTFDLVNGKFEAKTAGIYLFHFSGYYAKKTFKPIPDSACVLLRVNGCTVARSAPRVYVDAKKSDEPECVIVSSFLWLEEGDEVDCFSHELFLQEDPTYEYDDEDMIRGFSNITTRFSAFYFSDE